MERLIHWWFAPKFPDLQTKKVLEYKPESFKNLVNDRIRTWLIHPIKRRLAKYYLLFLQRFFGIKVLGITGSSGKTTLKEMIADILSTREETVATFANIDPVFNIPTTILKCKPATKYLVLEMGVEYPGDMDFYLWLAQPDVGIITNINSTHTEFLQDLDGVAKEKAKLIQSLSKTGYAILNADDKEVVKISPKTQAKIYWYNQPDSLALAENIAVSKDFKTSFNLIIDQERALVTLPLLGDHFISLALAAITVGQIFNISFENIKSCLENFKPSPHRMIPIRSKGDIVIIDDSYNANPFATIQSLKTFSGLGEGRKIFVFGEMKELGNYAVRGHEEVGTFAAKTGVDMIFSLGDLTLHTLRKAVMGGISKSNTRLFNNKASLINHLKKSLRPKDLILVKGSRFMAMEEIVEAMA